MCSYGVVQPENRSASTQTSNRPALDIRLRCQPWLAYRYLPEYGSYFGGWRRRLALKMWTGWPTVPMVSSKASWSAARAIRSGCSRAASSSGNRTGENRGQSPKTTTSTSRTRSRRCSLATRRLENLGPRINRSTSLSERRVLASAGAILRHCAPSAIGQKRTSRLRERGSCCSAQPSTQMVVIGLIANATGRIGSSFSASILDSRRSWMHSARSDTPSTSATVLRA